MNSNPTKNFRTFLTFILSVFFCLAAAAQTDDFETFMQRIRDDHRRNLNIDQSLRLYNDKEGSFTDIDYSRDDRTNWPPQKHLERLATWTSDYTNPKNKWFGDDALYGRIVKALQFWQDRDPNCNNWWYNQIAEPQALGVMLIQMRDGKRQVPKDLETAILQRMRTDGGDPDKWTGANRTDICMHWMYRSCLERNENDMEKAMRLIFDPVRYTTEEGFQHDGSYFQHGQQLYIGGYGEVILKCLTEVAMYARGTKYAMPDDKVQLVSRFMRETYYPAIRGRYMLFDIMGRSISRRNILDKRFTSVFCNRMAILDPAHAQEFKDIAARLKGEEPASFAVTPRHTHFFRADYTMHVRPGYTFDVRMSSTRTSRVEYGNRENLKGYFAADGCDALVKRGNEYLNIAPAWNWTMLPGTTAPQVRDIPLNQREWQSPGYSQFAGGVSDSLYGATALAYEDTWKGIDTRAKKAWFFFDNEIVCLGAGISSSNSNNVMTTVNQRLAERSDVVEVAEGNNVTAINACGEIDSRNVKWIRHDGTGYVFPKGGNIHMRFGKQSGNWQDINKSMPDMKVTKQVFSLAVNHGLMPADASYAYIIVPDATNKNVLNEYAKRHISILSNTPDLQAVEQTDLGIWQMVFYKAGSYSDRNVNIGADKPCIVMLRRHDDGSVTLHVADPAQKQQHINVSVRLKGSIGKTVMQTCDFTGSGVYAGQTKSYRLK